MSSISTSLKGEENRTSLVDEVARLHREVSRLRAMAAPRESGAWYRFIYENIPLMYFTMDRDGVILSVNAHGADQLGYREEELIGQPVLTVFHEEDRPAVKEQFASCVKELGRVKRWDFRKVRKDGTILWVRESARAVRSGKETLVLVICEDATERKQDELQLIEQQHRLQTLAYELVLAEERERRRIAIGLHDQIGQTLAVARGELSGLVNAPCAAELASAVKRIHQRIDQAIDATRSLTFELSSPILYELGLEAAVQDLGERMAEQSGANFQFRAGEGPRPLGDVTSIVLFRAVRELLFNVTKHARARNVTMAVETVGGRIRISLGDDGVGFDATAAERFTAAGGFGLFSTREQLEEIGGRLAVETAPGKGTRVVLEAPLESSDE